MRKRLVSLVIGFGMLLTPSATFGQATRGTEPLPSIDEKTVQMRKIDGFFPLYWDESAGRLWMEISRLNTEVLYITGLGAGLGSNDIGLDRGQLSGSRIVIFERVGPRILMVQPNYRFRARTQNPAELRAVRDAFARSVLFGFQIAAESNSRVVVDVTEFLVRDTQNIAQRLRPGSYRFEPSRSSIYLPVTMGFPKNTEMEVELTFVSQPSGGTGGGFGGGGNEFFEGVWDGADCLGAKSPWKGCRYAAGPSPDSRKHWTGRLSEPAKSAPIQQQSERAKRRFEGTILDRA